MSKVLNPFQLLELNLISAQDLAQVSRTMKTYALAWVHPDRKLCTRADSHGHNNPTWNDKLVFRVDDGFLHSVTSAITIDIYAVHWFKDVFVGSVRVLVSNLIPNPPRTHYFHHVPQVGMRFAALQVRRPSGRPQGILNIGVALLHSSMRSMPLCPRLCDTSAVGYRLLMGEDPRQSRGSLNQTVQMAAGKLQLRSTKSDSSSQIASDLIGSAQMLEKKKKTSKSRASSMIDGSEVLKRKGKGRRSGGISLINGNKVSSIIDGSEINPVEEPPRRRKVVRIKSVSQSESVDTSIPKKLDEEAIFINHPVDYGTPPRTSNHTATPSHRNSYTKFDSSDYIIPRKSSLGGPILTDSELGTPPSEVAAAVAAQPKNIDADGGGEKSVIGGMSFDGSVEGLESKLERWRTELTPVYDRGESSSLPSSKTRHVRQRTKDKEGGFSCFSNICGCRCSIVCGGSGERSKKKVRSGRVEEYV